MILVFGKNGQVGRELDLLKETHCLDRDTANLEDPESCYEAILSHKPLGVINAAAYTNVDNAEKEEGRASIINGLSPKFMADACTRLKIPLIHISTDYVFNGIGQESYKADDETNPKSAYGRTKLLGERGILASEANFVILRTSWVFSNHGKNFVKTILKKAIDKKELSIIGDQVGGPTSARSIAMACLLILKKISSHDCGKNIFHFSGYENVSWADFAREILLQCNLNNEVKEIKSSDYFSKVSRPFNSRLDCSSLEQVFGIVRPSWRRDLRDVIKALRFYFN